MTEHSSHLDKNHKHLDTPLSHSDNTPDTTDSSTNVRNRQELTDVNENIISKNTHGTYLTDPERLLTNIPLWAPTNFTNPAQCREMQQRGNTASSFKFIVHTVSLSDLINGTGIFAANAQNDMQQWDAISASVISDKKPFSYKSVGVILKVPEQNILAAYREDLMSELNAGLLHRTDHLVGLASLDKKLVTKQYRNMSPPERNGLLSKAIFSLSGKMETPDNILRQTYDARNEIIVALRPGVNIHPGYPVTGSVEITGVFLMDSEPNANAKYYADFYGNKLLSKSKKHELFTRYALPFAQKAGIPVLFINGQADVAEDSSIYKTALISVPHNNTNAANITNVSNWDMPDVSTLENTAPSIRTTRFDGQIIIQLENDPVVLDAAVKLAAKHPGKSVLVQLDTNGVYRVVYGNPVALKGKLRWQLVGHGQGGNNESHHQTLAARSATALATNLTGFHKAFNSEFNINSTPGYISLVSCSMAGYDKKMGYARQLALSLYQQRIRTDISVRSTQVHVNDQGQKLTQNDEGGWSHSIGENKSVLVWNNQDELIPATCLAARLQQTVAIVDDLAAGKITLPSLAAAERDSVTDFFHTTNGTLDSAQLQTTITDPEVYYQFREQSQNLMQFSKAHIQLEGFSGKEALQRSQVWDAMVIESAVTFHEATKKYAGPEVNSQTFYAPQGLYIGDGSPATKQNTANLGLVYLYMLSQGEADRLQLLIGLHAHAEINEQKVATHISVQQADQVENFSQLLNHLNTDKTRFAHQGSQTLEALLQQISQNAQDGYYQLAADKHVLTLAKRSTNGQATYYLYDPNQGEARFSGDDTQKTISALKATLTDYLISKNSALGNQSLADYYGVKQQGDQFEFDVYKLNDVNAGRDTTLNALQQLLQDGFTTEAKRTNSPSSTTPVAEGASGHLSKINHVIGSTARFSQGVGWVKSTTMLSNYWRRLNSGELTLQQKQALELEINIAIGGLVYDLASEVTDRGFTQLGSYLSQQTTKRTLAGLPRYPSRLGGMGYRIGNKLAKFGSPILNVFGSGFDIYAANQAVEKLKTETDPKIRADLRITATLSSLGAAVNIATALALAAGGTAAMFGGPIGAAIGIGIAVGGGIYSAMRQIEDIKQYVTLSPLQELRNGWFAFWGQDIDVEILNKIVYAQTMEQGRQEYDRLLADYARKSLRANSAIDSFYYSRGTVDFQPQRYKRLRGRQAEQRPSNLLGDRTVYYSSVKILQDKIQPDQSASVYDKHYRAEYSGKNHYSELELEDSDYEFYTPKDPSGINDTIDANNTGDVVQAPFTGQKQRVAGLAHSLIDELDIHNTDYHSVIGDFNADKRSDIGYFSRYGFYLLFAEENGTYSPARLINNIAQHSENQNVISFPGNPQRLVGDVNGDKRDDIIAILPGNGESKTILHIMLNQGKGAFHSYIQEFRQNIQKNSYRPGPVLGDINGDGHADLVSFEYGQVHIYHGKKDGTFNTENTALLPSKQAPLNEDIKWTWFENNYVHQAMGDINGDGFSDVVSFTEEGEIHTLLGSDNLQKKFTALAEQDYPMVNQMYRPAGGFKHEQLQLHDMNNDGRADLVAIKNDGSYVISYGQVEGTFGPVTDGSQCQEQDESISYRPNILAVRGKEHILGITVGSDGHNALLSLNMEGEVNAHTFNGTRIRDTIAYFSMGDGNDKVDGDPERKNVFEVEGGKKIFTGGRYSDTFLLMGKPAPDEPSVLDGGTNPHNRVPFNDDDTIIVNAKPTEGGGYSIFLGDGGFVAYTASGKRIADLHNIEHAHGHKETDDLLVGNERDNQLHGGGGKDVLIGNAGNDVLTLSAGRAIGGTGTDSYRILQNDHDADVEVTLIEQSSTQGHSNIMLDHNAEQIESITLEENDVIITLRNNNKTLTWLKLKNLYLPATSNNEKNLAHNYILYTHDGLLITGWPKILIEQNGNWPLTPSLTAQYQPELDQRWQESTKGKTAEEISIRLQRQNEQGQGQIDVASRTTVVPKFIQLLLQGTRFSDRLEGDSDHNLLRSSQGYDVLVGKSGTDYYLIDSKNAGNEVTIDNFDDAPASNLAQDILLLSQPIEDIHLEQKENDIVFSHRNAPELHPKVRIVNFKLGERYRHLSLIDKKGSMYSITINQQGQATLVPEHITPGHADTQGTGSNIAPLIYSASTFEAVENNVQSSPNKGNPQKLASSLAPTTAERVLALAEH